MARAKPRSKRSSAKKTPATKKRAKASPPAKKAAKTGKRSGAPKGAAKTKGKARVPKSAPRSAPKAQAKAVAAAPAQTQGSEEKGGDAAPSGIGQRIEVRNVNVPGYRTTVDARKYHAMKDTLLAVLPKAEPGLTQSEMFAAVRGKLPEDVFPGQQKAEWWVKCVQLDLEARGGMRRSASKPLRWRAA